MIKENLKIEAMTPKRDKKKRKKHAQCTADYLECPTCGHVAGIWAVEFDAKLARSLQWAMEEYKRTGNAIVGITRLANPNVPDWVIQDRAFSKLKYWGVIIAAGQGKYKLTDIDRIGQFIKGISEGPKKGAPRYMVICADKVLSKAEERISFARAMGMEMSA